MNSTTITVEAIIAADISKVWQYWTNPEHITNWNFASDDWHCPKAANNLQVGGKFVSTMAAKDGSMSFDFEGVFDEIIENKIIAYTLLDGRKVLINFVPTEQGVKVVESFEPENTHSLELQKTGWQAILNNFKAYTEAN
jgi:uncharacterized protein YndB with AHSA1/START domain